MTDYCNLTYWKIVDLIVQENDHLRSPHNVRSLKVAVYHDVVTNLYHACCVWFHACCSFVNSYNWEIVTPTFTRETLDKYDYYHLTGALDVSDYNSPIEHVEEVDMIVLADKPNMVLINAGYWPAYNDAGNLQWHWLGSGPQIAPATDDEVFDWHLKGLFGGISIIFEDRMLDINDDDIHLEGLS